MTTTPATAGRSWARGGLVLGGVVSVAANVAHSFIPPHGAPVGWHPQVGAVVGAIGWPVYLFVAIEILARVAWPNGFGYWLLRFGGMLPVALVAALVSYRHLSGLLAYYGEEPLVYHLGPLAVDGLMVMATGALLAIGHNTSVSVGTPAVATVPQPFQPPSMPPAAVQPAPVPTAAPAPVVSDPVPPMPTPAEVAPRITPPAPPSTGRPATVPARTAPAPRTRPADPVASRAPLAPPATDSSVTAPGAAQPLPTLTDPAKLARARQIAAQYRTENGTPIRAVQLARWLKVSSDEAARYLAAIDHDPDPSSAPTVNGHAMKANR